jgi:2-oxoglutarate ferredoxin oxidoreductase subunit delta
MAKKMTVDTDRCKGCGLCVTACPKKIVRIQTLRINKKGYYTSECMDDDACIACALCAMMCPDCAIIIKAKGGKDHE